MNTESKNQTLSKDLYCAAWHLKHFVENAKNNEVANFTRPCETCRKAETCNFDFYEKATVLTEITGIVISPAIKKPDQFLKELL